MLLLMRERLFLPRLGFGKACKAHTDLMSAGCRWQMYSQATSQQNEDRLTRSVHDQAQLRAIQALIDPSQLCFTSSAHLVSISTMAARWTPQQQDMLRISCECLPYQHQCREQPSWAQPLAASLSLSQLKVCGAQPLLAPSPQHPWWLLGSLQQAADSHDVDTKLLHDIGQPP